jgi:hypothetical protein
VLPKNLTIPIPIVLLSNNEAFEKNWTVKHVLGGRVYEFENLLK